MNFIELWTRFDGRINRKPYWIGALVLIIPLLIGWWALAEMLFGEVGAGTFQESLLELVFTLIIAYPATALMVKRLHDRNRPGIIAAIFWAPSVLQIAGGLLGIVEEPAAVGTETIFAPTAIGWVIIAISLAIGIWSLIELGILKGTDGPNQYGPDPLKAAR